MHRNFFMRRLDRLVKVSKYILILISNVTILIVIIFGHTLIGYANMHPIQRNTFSLESVLNEF